MAPASTKNEFVDVDDIIQVKNVGTGTWRAGWNSVQYAIPPGKSKYIPMHVIVSEFGDPRSTSSAITVTSPSGRAQAIPSRGSEVARLCQLYGAYDDILKLQRKAPKIELYDQDGIRIYSPIDDPSGENAMEATPVEGDERSALYTHIAKLTARLDALEHDTQGHTTADPEADDDDIGSDLIGTKPDMPGDEFSTAFTLPDDEEGGK
jgi:hypothetical protein